MGSLETGLETGSVGSAPTRPLSHLLRLNGPAQFQAVMSAPPVGKTPHFALHTLALPCAGDAAALFAQSRCWLGLVVPKRWAKQAVTRNAVRRQVNALAQQQLRQAPGWPDAAVVVRLRSTFSREQFVSATSPKLKAAVRAELEQLFARALFRLPSRVGRADTAQPAVQPPVPIAAHA
jgi:ribonuclease P protein component